MKNNDNKKKNTAQNQADKKKKPTSKVVKTAVLGTVLGLFSCAVVGLSVALYYAQTSVNTHEAYQRQMDAIYQRAYYDLLDGASDLGINLRKIGVSNSKSMQQSLLYEVWNASELQAAIWRHSSPTTTACSKRKSLSISLAIIPIRLQCV